MTEFDRWFLIGACLSGSLYVIGIVYLAALCLWVYL